MHQALMSSGQERTQTDTNGHTPPRFVAALCERRFRMPHIHCRSQIESQPNFTRDCFSTKIRVSSFRLSAKKSSHQQMLFRLPIRALVFLALFTLAACATRADNSAPPERFAFIGRKDFSGFTNAPGAAPGETILTSPEIAAPIAWDELIASWNET